MRSAMFGHVMIRTTVFALCLVACGPSRVDRSPPVVAPLVIATAQPHPTMAQVARAPTPPESPIECRDTNVGRSDNLRHVCTVQFISAAVKEKLESYPDRERVTVWFGTNRVTQEALESLTKVPWLTEFSADDASGVTSLAPLRELHGLTHFTLDEIGKPMDLGPVAGLTHLRSVRLVGGGVSSVEPLRGLPALETVIISSLSSHTIEPLAGKTTLTTLYIAGTGVTDISPIRTLTSLTDLNVGGLRLVDLSFVTPLTALTTLTVSDTSVKSLAPIISATRLSTLAIDGTPISDLTPLEKLPNLQVLLIRNTAVTDFTPLTRMPRLHQLFASVSPPQSILNALKKRRPDFALSVAGAR